MATSLNGRIGIQTIILFIMNLFAVLNKVNRKLDDSTMNATRFT